MPTMAKKSQKVVILAMGKGITLIKKGEGQ